MRIAITGTHGTGKTTLAQMVAERLNLPLITEAARYVARVMSINHAGIFIQDKALARMPCPAIRVSGSPEERAAAVLEWFGGGGWCRPD